MVNYIHLSLGCSTFLLVLIYIISVNFIELVVEKGHLLNIQELLSMNKKVFGGSLILSYAWFDMMADPTPSDFFRILRTVFFRITRDCRKRKIWYVLPASTLSC